MTEEKAASPAPEAATKAQSTPLAAASSPTPEPAQPEPAHIQADDEEPDEIDVDSSWGEVGYRTASGYILFLLLTSHRTPSPRLLASLVPSWTTEKRTGALITPIETEVSGSQVL